MSLWSRFFGDDPKSLFFKFAPHSSTWRVVSWNFDLSGGSERRWVVELESAGKKSSIQWQKGSVEEVLFFEDQRLIRKRRIPEGSEELKTLMNLAVHSTLKFSLEENHEFMVTPVPGATTLDMQNEARALEWIKASFMTLSRALDRLAEDKSLILTGAFFAGIEPESGNRVLRIIAFNLDLFLYLRDDSSLQIVVFNDKDLGHGKAKEPSFQQIIKVTKPQFYDEIVKLVHRLAVVGEIK